MAIEKIKILGAILELSAIQHCQSSPFTSELGQIDQIGSAVYLAGSSKMAPRILIFSIAMGVYLIFILCENYCYFCPHIFWVYYFSLSQCGIAMFFLTLGFRASMVTYRKGSEEFANR